LGYISASLAPLPAGSQHLGYTVKDSTSISFISYTTWLDPST